MATFGEADGSFSGRSRYTLRVDVTRIQNDNANNRSQWRWSLQVINWDQSSLTWDASRGWASATINGVVVYDQPPPVGTYDFRDGALSHSIASGTIWITHNSDGTKAFSIVGGAANAGIFGNANAVGSVTANRIQKAPSKAPTPVLTSRTNSSLAFTIAQPSDDGGSAITTYNMQVATDSSFSQVAKSWSSASSSQSASGLAPGTKYYVRYRAVNVIGAGAWSSTLSTSTLATVPGIPSRPTAGSVTSSSVSFSFSAPSSNGGSSITGYDHQIATNSSFTSGLATWSDNSSPASRSGLSPNQTYYVRTRAKNAEGAGGWSSALTISTVAAVPDKPATPTLSARTFNSLTWAFVNPPNNGATITNWQHQISASSSFSSIIATITDANTPASRSSLAPATTYYIRSRAQNSAGHSPWSSTLTAATLSTTPSAPPTPKISVTTATSLEFTFQAPSNGGSAITGYDHQISTSSSFSSATTWSDNTSPASRTGLNPNTLYYIRTRAKNADGNSSWSSALAARTSTAVPGKAPKPVYSSRTPTSITFTIAPPSTDGGSAITTYSMQAATNAAFTTGLVAWSAPSLTQTASPLVPGTTYYIRYRAVNAVGPGAWSDVLTQASQASGPPSITVTAAPNGTSAGVKLTQPVGGPPTSYRIERRTTGQTAITTLNTTSTTVTVNGLTPGRSYQWRASALYGDYQTAQTAWITLVQPKPNTTPGDYFDGATAAETDVSYRWAGTANASKSEAVGRDPLGWASWSSSYGTQPLIRVTGGRSGPYSVRVTFVRDMLEGDVIIGMHPNYPAAVAEGGVYWGSIYIQVPRAQRMRLETIWLNAAGTEISRDQADGVVVQPGAWRRVSARATAPAGAVKAFVRARTMTDGNYPPFLSGEWIQADDAMLTVGELLPWFSGDTRDTATTRYDWLGAANQSVSMATRLEQAYIDPLADPDCVAIPQAPQPPKIDDSCIDTVGSWRRYWAIIPGSQVLQWLTVVPTITMQTGASAARQVRLRFYQNPDELAPEESSRLEVSHEQTISYVPPNSTFTLDGVSRRAWASVGDDDTQLAAGHLLHGQNGAPATWPTLSCGIPYLISFDVPLDAPEGNLTIDVALTDRML